MGRLIDRGKRERARAARVERREILLGTALQVFAGRPPSEVALDELSRRAQIPESTARILWSSTEELFLDVLERELRSWAEALEERLAPGGASFGRKRLLGALVDELASRPLLIRLLGHLPAVLEGPVDVSVATGFLHRQHGRLERLGGLLEARWRPLGSGQGPRLLWRVWRAVSGIAPFARPTGALAVALVDRDLEALRVEPGSELRDLVDRLLPERIPPGPPRR